MKRFYLLLIVLGIIYGTAFYDAKYASASEGRIAKVAVALNKDAILVSANLLDGFNKDIEEAIKNGIGKDILYSIALKKIRSTWFDEDVILKEIKYSIKYDVLKKQYTVTTQDDGNKEKVMQDFIEIKIIVSKIENLMLSSKKILEPEEEYYVSVKAEMKDTKLPFFLDYFLFFIPFSDINTSWTDSATFKLEKNP